MGLFDRIIESGEKTHFSGGGNTTEVTEVTEVTESPKPLNSLDNSCYLSVTSPSNGSNGAESYSQHSSLPGTHDKTEVTEVTESPKPMNLLDNPCYLSVTSLSATEVTDAEIQCAACRHFDRWFCRNRQGSWNRAKGQDPHLFHACSTFDVYTGKSTRNIWEYQRQPNHTLDGLVSE